MNRTLARRARRGSLMKTADIALESKEETSTVLACLVGHNGLWASYVATPEQLEAKEQPTFITGYSFVSALRETVTKQFPAFNGDFTDYKAFWEKLGEAGIEKPEKMPHREEDV